MSDGVAITAGAGTTISTDDCGASGHVQRVKLAYGADGDATQVDADVNGLKVQINSPLTVYNATGSAAIALSTTMAKDFRLVAVTCHFNAAPTTSQSLTVKLNANDGAAYDTTLYSVDPSSGAVTDIVYLPENLLLENGDEIDVAYTNTDAKTYGLRIVCEAV